MTNPAIVSSHAVERDYVLLYIEQPLSHADAIPVGLGYAKRGWRGWYLSGQKNFQSASLTNMVQHAHFEVRKESYLHTQFSMVIGRAYAADVQQVQATFDTGRTVRGDLYDQSFALMDEGADNVCSFAMLDKAGDIVETVEWPQCQNDQPFRTK